MTEPTVDAGTRGAILEALVAKTKAKETPKKSAGVSGTEFDESTPFSTLLEESIKKRTEIDEEDVKADDEVRDRVIRESKVDMIDGLMKRLL